jgi:ribosomal protein S18 acetylase RimI-like enzyme
VAVGAAGPADVPEIARLAARDLEGAWSERGFADQVAKQGAAVWAARDGARGELSGFLVAERILDELHVLSVAVTPARRRRGIARALVARALESASSAGVDVVHLELRASNRAARALYEGFGFVAVGRRPRYYRPASGASDHARDRAADPVQDGGNARNEREDAVLMTLVLGASPDDRPGR